MGRTPNDPVTVARQFWQAVSDFGLDPARWALIGGKVSDIKARPAAGLVST
jgi:hypothetical protein